MILLVSLYHVRHLSATRPTPRSPEVNQHPFSFAHILAQLVHVAVGIGLLQVGKLLTDIGSLLSSVGLLKLVLLDSALHSGMVSPNRLGSHHLLQLLQSEFLQILLHKGHRNHGVHLVGINLLQSLLHAQLAVGRIHVDIVAHQSLVLGRSSYGSVVQVHSYRCAIVDNGHHPANAAVSDYQQRILLGRTANAELAVLNRSVLHLTRLSVNHYHLGAVILTHTTDGVVYLLGLSPCSHHDSRCK